MDWRRIPEEHPVVWTSFCIGVISLPQWFQSVWSIFTTDAPYPAIRGWLEMHPLPMPAFSPYWITVPVGAGMFLWLIVELRRRQDNIIPVAQPIDGPFDVSTWLNHESYFVWVAACLWVNIRPKLPVNAESPAYSAMQKIKAALESEKIASLFGGSGATARVSRNELIKFANLCNERPQFLFPEQSASPFAATADVSTYLTPYQAIHYLVNESQWGALKKAEVTLNGDKKNTMLEALEEFKKRAEEGRLKAYGYNDKTHLHEFIDKTYWMSAGLDPISCFNSDSENKTTSATFESGFHGVPVTYFDLKIEAADVYKTWPRSATPSIPKSLEQHFREDFKLGAYMTELIMSSPDGLSVKIPARVYFDHDANSKFLSFYIPRCPDSFTACASLARDYKIALDESANVKMIAKHAGDATHTDSTDLSFSGRIFLYHEDTLSLEQLGALEILYKSKSLAPQFRGHDWTTARWMSESMTKKSGGN